MQQLKVIAGNNNNDTKLQKIELFRRGRIDNLTSGFDCIIKILVCKAYKNCGTWHCMSMNLYDEEKVLFGGFKESKHDLGNKILLSASFFSHSFNKLCLKRACYLITATYIKQQLTLLLEIASSVLKVAWDDMIAESKELI